MNKFDIEDSFVINRSKKAALFTGLFGILCIIIGISFLYAYVVAPDVVTKWLAIMSGGTGIIAIFIAIVSYNTPLITANSKGIQLDINIFCRKIFLFWKDIKNIRVESTGTFGRFSRLHETKCLAIEISDECQKQLPKILKTVYLNYYAENLLYCHKIGEGVYLKSSLR